MSTISDAEGHIVSYELKDRVSVTSSKMGPKGTIRCSAEGILSILIFYRGGIRIRCYYSNIVTVLILWVNPLGLRHDYIGEAAIENMKVSNKIFKNVDVYGCLL